MSATPSARMTLIGDAAIEVLIESGMRGLTHRAVDNAAGLPAGSTSYYARTRSALLELTVGRMVELDEVHGAPEGRDVPALAESITQFLVAAMNEGKKRMLARYELALEATRRPSLRVVYNRAGLMIREEAGRLLTEAGSSDPIRHADMLIRWCDGVLFDAIAGAGAASQPTRDELFESTVELLHGMLHDTGPLNPA